MKVANTVPKSGVVPLRSRKSNNLLTPKVARHFSRVDSTNLALLRAVEENSALPAGTVYVCDEQTAGKGQGSNRWHSSAGDNLTFSFLLRPAHLAVERLFSLTQLASLALHDSLVAHDRSLGRLLRIKWPNDLYAEDRKLAGILIQNGLRGKLVQWSVIGIGLNVNESDFPAPLDKTATSLRYLVGERVDQQQLLDRFFHALQSRNEMLEAGKFRRLKEDYHQRLYRSGETVNFLRLANQQPIRGRVEGVHDDGRLQLTLPGDKTELFDLRSLRWLP